MKIRFSKNWATHSWEVFVFDRARMGYEYKIKIEKTGPMELPEYRKLEPAAEIDIQDFPDLIKEVLEGLSDAGLLASTPESLAQVEAIKYHLEDMRKLVFKGHK